MNLPTKQEVIREQITKLKIEKTFKRWSQKQQNHCEHRIMVMERLLEECNKKDSKKGEKIVN